MQRIILRAVLVGLVAGLIVGVYHNIFTVPIIERAIVIEEERAAAALPAGAQPEDEPPLVSLGMQRIGMGIIGRRLRPGVRRGLRTAEARAA